MRTSSKRNPTTEFFHRSLLEARVARDSFACYRLHTHPTLSVGIVDAGTSVLTLGCRQIPLRRGDVVIISPDVPHACNPSGGAWSYRMLYLDPVWAGVAGRNLRWKTPVRSNAARRWFNRLMTAAKAGPASVNAADLRRSLSALLRLGQLRTETESRNEALIDRVRAHIDQHYSEPLPMKQLARIVGISPMALVRLFKRNVGLTPHAYQIDRRIRRARELLKDGWRAAEVAQVLGFVDQSHFLRSFRSRVATTPRRYASIARAPSE